MPRTVSCGSRAANSARRLSPIRRPDDALLGDDAGDEPCGVTSKAGFQTPAPSGASRIGPRCVISRGVALLDRNRGRRRASRDRSSRAAPRHRTARRARAPSSRRCTCRSCWRRRRWPRCDRRRRRRSRCRRCCMSGPAMLSVMTVVGTWSRTSSHAVSRAPCRNGRVSSAKTCDDLALLGGRANDAERRAVAGRGQRAGVAVRQDPRVRPARPPRRTGPSLWQLSTIFVVDRAAPRARAAP